MASKSYKLPGKAMRVPVLAAFMTRVQHVIMQSQDFTPPGTFLSQRKDGCFNADPHPGNILMLEDGKTLGLIDFGQVMYVPVEPVVEVSFTPEMLFLVLWKWVIVNIMVPFGVPITIRHLIFRVPKKGP